MAKNAKVNVLFGADLKQFSTAMQNAERKINKMGRNMQKLGKGLTVGVTAPLLAIAVAGVRAWDQQEKAIAQVNAGLIATGNAVGYTSEELQKMASELQNNTLFGDEEILKDATAQLLTFTNIANEQFGRTQQAALDLATRLGGDLKSASIQLGKALNDPVANLSALSRSGIQFSTEQKKVINALAKTNQLAEAQTIILDELEKQYGGSAEAAAKAGLGPFQQLGNIIGDLNEDFGAIIGEALLPFIDKIKSMVLSFKELSPETKKFIVIIASVAAAIGPLLALAGTILPAILSGFALLASPVGLVVAALTAVGVIIYKNWTPIKKTLVDIANYFVDLYNESTVFRFAVDAITFTFKNMWTTAQFVFGALGSVLSAMVTSFVDGFKIIGKVIKGALTLDADLIAEAWEDFKRVGLSTTTTLIADLKDDWQKLNSGISDNLKKAIEGGGQRAKIVLKPEQIDTTAISNAVTGAASGKPVKSTAAAVVGNRTNKLVQPGIETDLTGDFKDLNKISLDNARNELALFQESQYRLAETSAYIGDSVAGSFAGMANGFVDSLGIADTSMGRFVSNILKMGVELISQLIKQTVQQIAINAAASTGNAIQGATQSATATGPAALYTLLPYIGIAVAGIAAAFASIPSFSTGGRIGGSSYYGDNLLARVNSGEVVLNDQQQQKAIDMMDSNNSNNNVQVTGTLKVEGTTLVAVLKNTTARNKAFGGTLNLT